MVDRFNKIYSSINNLVENSIFIKDIKIIDITIKDILNDINTFLEIDKFVSLEKCYDQVWYMVQFFKLLKRLFYVGEYEKNILINYFYEINRKIVEYAEITNLGFNNFTKEKVIF